MIWFSVAPLTALGTIFIIILAMVWSLFHFNKYKVTHTQHKWIKSFCRFITRAVYATISELSVSAKPWPLCQKVFFYNGCALPSTVHIILQDYNNLRHDLFFIKKKCWRCSWHHEPVPWPVTCLRVPDYIGCNSLLRFKSSILATCIILGSAQLHNFTWDKRQV